MAKRYELTDEQWRQILGLLLGKATDPGRSGSDNRQFVDSILIRAHIAENGATAVVPRNPTRKIHTPDDKQIYKARNRQRRSRQRSRLVRDFGKVGMPDILITLVVIQCISLGGHSTAVAARRGSSERMPQHQSAGSRPGAP